MTQFSGFLTGPALQLGIAEARFLAQLRRNHIRFIHRKTLTRGQGQQLGQLQGLLQALLERLLQAGVSQKGIELVKRQGSAAG